MKMMSTITFAMLFVRLFAAPSEANVSATADVMACVSQCPLDPKSMSPSSWCVVKNCVKEVGKCALDWACRKTLGCVSECPGPLAGTENAENTEDAEKFLDVQKCLKDYCPGFPPNVGCIAKNCKAPAAKCALASPCRHALECASHCEPSVADVGLARAESDVPTTTGDTMSCVSQCPLDPETMSPSFKCVIKKCFMKIGKCIFNSKCRNTLQCVSKCPAELAQTKDAHRFIELESCLTDRCPGFPPSKLCIAQHCASEAANCAIHGACRETLTCADKCSAEIDDDLLSAVPALEGTVSLTVTV